MRIDKLNERQENLISCIASEYNVRVSELRMILIKGIRAARYELMPTEEHDILMWYVGTKKDTAEERIAPGYNNRMVLYAERNRHKQQKKRDYEDRCMERAE